jgi:hypothetical protein
VYCSTNCGTGTFDQCIYYRSFDDYTPRCTLVCDNMPDWGIHEHCVADYIKGKLNIEDYDSIVSVHDTSNLLLLWTYVCIIATTMHTCRTRTVVHIA